MPKFGDQPSYDPEQDRLRLPFTFACHRFEQLIDQCMDAFDCGASVDLIARQLEAEASNLGFDLPIAPLVEALYRQHMAMQPERLNYLLTLEYDTLTQGENPTS